MIYTKEVEIGGKIMSLETGRYARQANGAVMVKYGETMVLVAAVASDEVREDIDFFPLSVEYREKSLAAGKIPGGFFKREGRPSEKEILSSRLIDRPIRPLFPDSYRNDTQIAAYVYSFDDENNADVLAAVGASAALTISNIPFLEPIAEVRIAMIEDRFIVNPTFEEVEKSKIELVVGGSESSIMMVEGESQDVTEDDLINALKFAHEEIKKLIKVQIELREAAGVPKMEVVPQPVNEELVAEVKAAAEEKLKALAAEVLAKHERAEKNKELKNEVITALEEKFPESESEIKNILHDMEKDFMRQRILKNGIRLDGRSTTEVRPITIDLGTLLRTHGSALFTRGETQSLMSLTLGSKSDEQVIDGLREEFKKRFLLHYNFPPFSVGETGRYSGPGRREVGHGNLAERALKYVLPPADVFPYTIRLNSDILESNGSSSMATVCSGSLAMMEGGVPISKAIAGIAMGLIKEGDDYAILTDILGAEDHLGDMDFKVAGSAEGITAFQMDIKIQGISFEIIEKALAQAKEGRLHILGKMNEVIRQPNEHISKYAPTMLSVQINPDKIGSVIGPGGKIIQGIQKDYSVEINIEEDGTVSISGQDSSKAKLAKEYIRGLVAEPEVGKIYDGKVIKITDFGAFVEILPGTQGLLHISQIAKSRIAKVTDVLKEGEEIKVKLLKIENGKMSLSRKVLLKDEPKKDEPKESN